MVVTIPRVLGPPALRMSVSIGGRGQSDGRDAGLADQPDRALDLLEGVDGGTRKRTSVEDWPLTDDESAAVRSSAVLDVPSSVNRPLPASIAITRVVAFSAAGAGRAGRVDRIRQQSGPFPDGHEAVGVFEDLDGPGEDVLLFGPEEAVEGLPGPRELDLEFDPAGQVGGDSPGDGYTLPLRSDRNRPETAPSAATTSSREPDVWPLETSV